MSVVRIAPSLIGKVKFDEADADLLAPYTWFMSNGYAKAENLNGKGKGYPRIYMHRLIMGVQKGLEVDHINGDRADNRRENLRVCLHSENCRNKGGVSGVYWFKPHGMWAAAITVEYKPTILGYFHTSAEASAAYRTAAKLLHGNFSHLARKNLHVA